MSRYDDFLTVPRTLPERDQLLVLRATGERRDGFRDHLLLAIALGTGLREHEIVALNIDDVFDQDRRARRRIRLRVYKRGAREPAIQEVVLSALLRRKLDAFLAWKERAGEDVSRDAPLFVSRRRRRLSTRQLRRLVHVWQKRAGTSVDLSFHALRHYADRRVMPRPARIVGIVERVVETHAA